MKVIWQGDAGEELEIPAGVDGAAVMKGDRVEEQKSKRYASRKVRTVISRTWRLVGNEPVLLIFLSEHPGNYT